MYCVLGKWLITRFAKRLYSHWAMQKHISQYIADAANSPSDQASKTYYKYIYPLRQR